MVTPEQEAALIAAIEKKAHCNRQKQAYITPSKFGFPKNDAGTLKCAEFLNKHPKVKSAKFSGKDTVDVILK